MSEKRFKKMNTVIDPFPIWDTVEEKGYNCTDTLDLLVDLLNEQSERIKSLEMELDLIANTKLFSRRKLEEDNEQLKKQLSACKEGQQNLMEEHRNDEEALDKIWNIIKELYGSD